MALCPLPIGAITSITLGVKSLILLFSISKVSFSSGYNGVKLSKLIIWRYSSGSTSLVVFTFKRAKYLSESLGDLISPSTLSPVLKLNLRTWLGLT